MNGGLVTFSFEDFPDLKRYIFHGLAFTALMFAVTTGSAVLLAFLLLIGSLIGLMIGLFVLIIAVGYMNTVITKFLWEVDMEKGWKVYLIHGILLMVLMVVASIPQVAANYVAPGLLTSLVTMAVYIPINGYIARWVSLSYELGVYDVPVVVPDEDW